MKTIEEIKHIIIENYASITSAEQFTDGSYEDDDFSKVEKELNLKLADDYKELFRKYKHFEFGTGEGIFNPIGKNSSGYEENVLSQTLYNRENYDLFPKDKYIIYDTLCEGIVFLQNSKGWIYEYNVFYIGKPKKKFSSLTEFINSEFELFEEVSKDLLIK